MKNFPMLIVAKPYNIHIVSDSIKEACFSYYRFLKLSSSPEYTKT